MKKILFVGNFLSKSRGSIGPSENIAKTLSKKGLKIITSSNHENVLIRFLDIIYSITFKKYDICHIDVFSGNFFYLSLASVLIAKSRNKKAIITLHGGRLPDFFSKNKRKFNLLLSLSDKALSPSKFIINSFDKIGFQILYLPNPINLFNFPFKEFKENKSENLRLLWVRAFHSIYNPFLAIYTLKKIKEDFPDATLTMAGPDKGLLNKTLDLIEKLSLTNSVNIVGSIDNTQLYKYYHSHSVYLNTTLYESFGVAVLEAASSGIPIISTKVGEIPLLWENKSDILIVPKLDESSFAEAIKETLAKPNLTKLRVGNARKKAEGFDWQIIESQWIKLLSK